jgi:hypothetical protein
MTLSDVESYQHFGGTRCLNLQGVTKSEKGIAFANTSNLKQYHCSEKRKDKTNGAKHCTHFSHIKLTLTTLP